jgi:probable HAF family extracellular repeat protein
VGESLLTSNPTPYHAFYRTQSGMIDLGTFGGIGSNANAVNNSGVVVGFADLAGGNWDAYQWTQAGGMQDIAPAGSNYSSATAINSTGVIVGNYQLPQSSDSHAAVWTGPNQVQDLGVLGGTYSTATGVNDAGQVVGYSTLQ